MRSVRTNTGGYKFVTVREVSFMKEIVTFVLQDVEIENVLCSAIKYFISSSKFLKLVIKLTGSRI